MTVQSDIASEALRRFPKTPTKTLAKKIYKENPRVFLNIEATRSVLRYLRGQTGQQNRRRATDKQHFASSGDCSPFDILPEGLRDYTDWSVYQINAKRTLVLADIHIPYHDKQALVLALEEGKRQGIDCLLLLGDGSDFYSLSFWDKDPRRREFKKERDTLLFCLDVICKQFPNAQKVYKIGNHEERLERYLKVKAPELFDCELLDFEAIITAKDFGIDVVKDKRLCRIGDFLYAIHGHEFGVSFFNPVNPARGLFLRGKANAICAHYHQTSQHTEPSMDGKLVSCYSIGCLSDLHPEYRPLNKWNHGFAIVENDGGQFTVHNKKIIKGKIY